ncbi:hypothetical protein IFM89_032782 [Coptis chinensis]|uniref:Uncharacterized protein n=1 Tax=Coptis chinensis TaxID=261450 RepID=A0A835MJW4_9MAGN|nr:hypothetical protein IFM89_032782 [Coptis chinensis]
MEIDSTTERYNENSNKSEDADIGEDGNEGEVGGDDGNDEGDYDILEETGHLIQRGIDACGDAIPADALRYFRRAYQMTQTKFVPAGDWGGV